MSKKATIIAVVNQKGGTGKTTTTENLGVGLALEGKKVLLVDTDPQASLTVSLGNPCPDDLSPTLSDLMGKIMMENPIIKSRNSNSTSFPFSSFKVIMLSSSMSSFLFLI